MAIAAREGDDKGRSEPPMLRFDIEAPGLPARTLELRQDIVRIGKLTSSHLQIQDPAVSRVHAVIEVSSAAEVFLIDLGSSNGTFVNGAKVSKQRLSTGDEILLGQTKVTVTIEGMAKDVPAADPNALPVLAGMKTVPSAPQPVPAAPAPAPSPVPLAAAAAAVKPPAPAVPADDDDDGDLTHAGLPSHARGGASPVAPTVAAPSAPVSTAPAAPALPAEAPPRPAAPAPKPAAHRPAPPSQDERERRFIAIGAAEPLSSQPNDAASIVEVRLAFGRDIIETLTFEASPRKGRGDTRKRPAYRKASEVTIGTHKDCDFQILDIAGIDQDRYQLLRRTADGFALHVRKGMLGRVRLDHEDVSFEDLLTRRETQDLGDGSHLWPLRRGAIASLRAGGTTIYIRSVPRAPKMKGGAFQADPRLLLSFLGCVAFSGALVWRAVTWPEIPAVLLEDRDRLNEKMVNMIISPQEKLRKAKIAADKSKDKDKDGVKNKGKDDAKDVAEAPKQRVQEKKKVESLSADQQRERDIKKVRTLGALSALQKDPTLRMILSGGGSGGGAGAIGGGGPDDLADWDTGAGGGSGDGASLGGFGPGGPAGGGGGGGGRYVGVGSLRTRGLRGGKSRARFGQGEEKIDDHQVKKPEVKVGEADVSGGLSREIIQRVIRSHLHEVRYCYERELVKQPRLYGKIVVNFTILPSGNVHKAAVKRSTMQNENVEGCILSRVNRWSFPKPYKGTPVIVSYPFLFKAAGKE